LPISSRVGSLRSAQPFGYHARGFKVDLHRNVAVGDLRKVTAWLENPTIKRAYRTDEFSDEWFATHSLRVAMGADQEPRS
jgi:hypothetical protein